MTPTTDQKQFVTALLDAEQSTPRSLRDPHGAPAGKRFDIYRNNVAVSLTEALEVAFPVVRKLVGEAFFKAMVGVYLRKHPPKSPILMLYGSQMPTFLADFEPARHLGYLPDIARLELALRESYHAEDHTPISPERLQSLPPDDLLDARFMLAPSLRVIPSQWPIYSIWQANTQENAPPIDMAKEDVMVVRPDLDPYPVLLPGGAVAFVIALQENARFGDAVKTATASDPGFDLTATFRLLLSNAIFTGLNDKDI